MRTPLALLPLAAAGLVAACGSSGGDNPASAAERAEQAQLRFARCMRVQGIDMPDPRPAAAGGGPTRLELADGGDPATLRRARRACERFLRAAAPELTPEQEAEMRDAAVRFARCMRAHGVDMPDPRVSGDGGVTIQVGGPAGGGDPRANPRFRAAEAACRRHMPRFGGAAGESPAGPSAEGP